MSKMLKEIRGDGEYVKFKTIFERTRERVDLEKDLTEVLNLHAGRTSRKLYGDKQYSVKALIDASLKDMSYRSRMVEIRVRASVQISILQEAIGALRKYLSTEYADDLREFGTVAERKSFVDRVLKTPLAYIEEANSLLDTIDIILKDLDQASFGLRNMLECLKLLDSSRAGRHI